jgi:DNA repair protein RecO (recombination protein O)
MRLSSKSKLSAALILKRSNTGEADRVVTLFTKESGRIIVIAKGVRKLKSTKRAYLEPGNLAKVLLIKTKSMPILTQASLIEDTSSTRSNLAKIRQMTQLLEIVDKLFVEEEVEDHVYQLVMRIRKKILDGSKVNLKQDLITLVEWLGYQNLKETQHDSILDYVAEITGKKMKSFEFLKPNS